MRWYAKILLWPVLAVNLLVALLLIGCAYSPVLPVESLPLLSLAGLAMPFVLVANGAFLIVWLLLYKRFMLVSVVAFLVCFPQIRVFFPINVSRQIPPEESIKVMSYNILSLNLRNATANIDNPVIAYLEGCDADIICLQEFPFSALKSKGAKGLLAAYPYRSYQLNNWSVAKSHYLCCLSKYPILSVEEVDFNSTSNGCAKYRILHGADTLVIYNCHLQSNNLNAENKSVYEQLLTDPNKDRLRSKDTREIVKKLRDAVSKRAAQANLVLAEARKDSSPYIVVCGDFNDSPISYTHKLFSQQFADAYVRSGNGPGFSYNRNKLFYRIDHILYSPAFEAYDCVVDHSVKASDHYPISCYLKKNEPNKKYCYQQ